jgi:SAM-dependent methyltransferase
MTEEMVTYYARRASEYDRVYTLPYWQADLARIAERVAHCFARRRVLEVACGTGYWTAQLARVAAGVDATDVNAETLAVARSRAYGPAPVTFTRRDAYAAAGGPPAFDAGFAGLWLSHVDVARMDDFLRAFHSHLTRDSPVLMFDERDVPERRSPTTRRDAAGNRYEPRKLDGGERYEIVKNFYDPARLTEILAPHASAVTCEELERFWLLTYRTR